MRIIGLVLIGALVFLVPMTAFALGLSVSTTLSSGTALGNPVLLKCTGYSYNNAGNPWTQCTTEATAPPYTLDFGTLDTRLRDSTGTDVGGAGCFYGTYFFIVYIFPDAWGGSGYVINSQASGTPAEILGVMVFTPVYSPDDRYSGATTGQGALNSNETTWNPDINVTQLANNYSLVLKSQRPRIVRAQYGIPPYPGVGDTRPAGWAAVPLSTTLGTYTLSITISISSF